MSDTVINKGKTLVTNEYFVSTISILAVILVANIVPDLPKNVTKMLGNIIVQFVLFYIIAFETSRRINVSVIASLIVIVLLLGVRVFFRKEKMVNVNNHAQITIQDGVYREAEPLNEAWAAMTQEKGPVGYPGEWNQTNTNNYETLVEQQVVEQAAEIKPETTVIAAANEPDEIENGEIKGMMSGIESGPAPAKMD